MTENFSFLFQYLKKENIAIDQQEFIFQIKSHTEYPSLLAISDTLSFFNVQNIVIKLDFGDIVHLPKNFIALIKKNNEQPFLTLIEKNTQGFKYQYGKKELIASETEFKDLYKDVVLVAETEVNDKVKTTSNFKTSTLIIMCFLLYIIFLFVNQSNLLIFLFSFLSLIGIYFSVQAILKEVGVETKFSASVCNLSASSDCDAVIKSIGVDSLGKFNYSNFSLAFFIAQFLLFFVAQVASKVDAFFNFQFYLLLSSIPITILSIYHQVKIAKKWCTICLLIIGLLYSQIGVVYSVNTSFLKINSLVVLVFLFFFSISYFLLMVIKDVLKVKNEQKVALIEAYRFKRNNNLFQLALTNSQTVEVEANSSSLLVGNPKAELKITLITNPFCGFCKEAHQIIEKIFKIYKEKICINFHFNYNIENKDEVSKTIHHSFVELYFSQGQESFMSALQKWFEEKITPVIENFTMNELRINQILNQQFIINQNNNINFTPCIVINDKIYPKFYDRKDLIYYLQELIEEKDNTRNSELFF